jgi:hypothetical protein
MTKKKKKMGAKHELKPFYRVRTLFIGFEAALFEWPLQTFLFIFPNVIFNYLKKEVPNLIFKTRQGVA